MGVRPGGDTKMKPARYLVAEKCVSGKRASRESIARVANKGPGGQGFSTPLQKATMSEFRAVGSIQLRCGFAVLRKASGMAPLAGEGPRTSIVLLSALMRLRNYDGRFVGEGWNRSDLPV